MILSINQWAMVEAAGIEPAGIFRNALILKHFIYSPGFLGTNWVLF